MGIVQQWGQLSNELPKEVIIKLKIKWNNFKIVINIHISGSHIWLILLTFSHKTKYLNLITDMTSTGNSMGKLFETLHCQNKLMMNFSAQSLYRITKFISKRNKRGDYNLIQQKIIKKRKRVNWTVPLNPGDGKLWFPHILGKFPSQEWVGDWMKLIVLFEHQEYRYFKIQNIFLVSTKKNDGILKTLKIIGSSWDLQGNKE